MPCESKSWRPAHWSVTKRRLFEDHVYQWMEIELNEFLGLYEGRLRAAEVRSHRRAVESIAALRNAGVRKLGEVGS